MPSTVNANKLTVVHAGSSGVAFSFPDVCKTPTPAGPVPIPYPNIAQSADTAEGSSTVKVDGNPIMLKNSNFALSTGDEAGSAMGFKSSKIKGKAKPGNASFDVKVDGKCVFRLTDPMLSNGGSENALVPVEFQSPQPEGVAVSKECARIMEKSWTQERSEVSRNSGMLAEHFDAIKRVCEDLAVIMYFRQTASDCHKWIKAGHQPKPHIVFLANTISRKEQVDEVKAFLHARREKSRIALAGSRPMLFLDSAGKLAAEEMGVEKGAHPFGTNRCYSEDPNDYIGVVGEEFGINEHGVKLRRPLPGLLVADNLGEYTNKWITGDYDLYEVLFAMDGCEPVNQKNGSWKKVKAAVNWECGWDAIQHGPQVQWVPSEDDVAHGAVASANFPARYKAGLEATDRSLVKDEVPIPGRPKGMKVFDNEVTIIAPAGVVRLETQDDTWDAMTCRECHKK